MVVNDYTLISSFTLYDHCLLGLSHKGDSFGKTIFYTEITYSLSESGALIEDKNLMDDEHRFMFEIDESERYFWSKRSNIIRVFNRKLDA